MRVVAALLVAVVAAGIVAAWSSARVPAGPDVVHREVSIPRDVAPPATDVVSAEDRRARPAYCGENLQDLPRPIRRSGLHLGTLHYRDGRLCAPLPAASGGVSARCDPPSVLACPVP